MARYLTPIPVDLIVLLAERTPARAVTPDGLGAEVVPVEPGEYRTDLLVRETNGGFGREYYVIERTGQRVAVRASACHVRPS